MPGQRQRNLLRLNSNPIVANSNQSGAAALQLHLDALRLRIQRVFHQFLDHGRRPLDHLAGSDLIDESIG